jgi:hypothetical protein
VGATSAGLELIKDSVSVRDDRAKGRHIQAEDHTSKRHPNNGNPGDGFRPTAKVERSRLAEMKRTNGSV